MKADFLKGLQTKKYSIRDLQKDEMIIVLDSDDGGYICYETGKLFTEEDRLKGIAAGTWVEL